MGVPDPVRSLGLGPGGGLGVGRRRRGRRGHPLHELEEHQLEALGPGVGLGLVRGGGLQLGLQLLDLGVVHGRRRGEGHRRPTPAGGVGHVLDLRLAGGLDLGPEGGEGRGHGSAVALEPDDRDVLVPDLARRRDAEPGSLGAADLGDRDAIVLDAVHRPGHRGRDRAAVDRDLVVREAEGPREGGGGGLDDGVDDDVVLGHLFWLLDLVVGKASVEVLAPKTVGPFILLFGPTSSVLI